MGAVPPDELSDTDIIKINGVEGLPDKEVVAKDVSIIIEERLKEIAAMVMSEIMRSGYNGQLISGIVLTGGSSNIIMIRQVFYEVSNHMNIRVGKTLRNIKKTQVESIRNPKYSTVVGLLISGFSKLDERVSDEVIFGESHKVIPVSTTPNTNGNTNPGQKPSKIWDWLRQLKSDQDLGDDTGYVQT